MDNTFKNKIKSPRSALALYVMIYCKRRDATKSKYHNILTEATKSWLSLSKMEKLQFLTKYNDCQTKYNRKFADHLKKTKPYMKKKQALKSNRDKNTKEATIDNNSTNNGTKMSIMDIDNPDNLITSAHDIDHFDTSRPVSERQSIMLECKIPEPTPPVLITGEQLFNMVHEREDNNNGWATLPQAQKRNYQNAILAIKKKYLHEYQTYLESLTSQKLICVYKSVVH